MGERFTLTNFIRESNRIEGIVREPTEAETAVSQWFLQPQKIIISDLVKLVSIYQPDARLRDQPGLNVCVGNHIAPPGGPEIVTELKQVLSFATGTGSPLNPIATF